jgi:hypothetical protein
MKASKIERKKFRKIEKIGFINYYLRLVDIDFELIILFFLLLEQVFWLLQVQR